MNNINIQFEENDHRPPFILDDVNGASFRNIRSDKTEDSEFFRLKEVTDLEIKDFKSLDDQDIDKIEKGEL